MTVLALTEDEVEYLEDILKSYRTDFGGFNTQCMSDRIRLQAGSGEQIDQWTLDSLQIDIGHLVRCELQDGAIVLSRLVKLSVPVQSLLTRKSKPEWLLPSRLERRTFVIKFGPPGSFKSAEQLDAEMRIALNGGAIYKLSAEGNDVDRRIAGWLQEYAPNVSREDLQIHVVERRIDLNTDRGVAAVVDDIERLRIRPDVISIDTISKLAVSLNESDNPSVRAFLYRLDIELRERFDSTICLVGHSGNSEGGRIRGASVWKADTDAEHAFTVRKGIVKMTRDRFKGSAALPPLSWAVKVVGLGYADDDGEEITTIVLAPTDTVATTKVKAPKLPVLQKVTFDSVTALLMFDDAVEENDLIAEVIKHPSRREMKSSEAQQRGNTQRAIDDLVKSGRLRRTTDNRITLPTA
jgi:hypothetical protein